MEKVWSSDWFAGFWRERTLLRDAPCGSLSATMGSAERTEPGSGLRSHGRWPLRNGSLSLMLDDVLDLEDIRSFGGRESVPSFDLLALNFDDLLRTSSGAGADEVRLLEEAKFKTIPSSSIVLDAETGALDSDRGMQIAEIRSAARRTNTPLSELSETGQRIQSDGNPHISRSLKT